MRRDTPFGLQLGLPNLLFLVAVGISTALATALTHQERLGTWAIAAAAALATGVVTYRSRTALGWIGRRISFRRASREKIFVDEADNTGITWDGQRAAAYIEISPQPYESTIVGTDQETTIRSLPIDAIREELVQFDIRCDAITIVTIGHKYHRQTQLATTYHAAVGPTPALLYGRTFVEVAVDLSRSLDSVYARRGHADARTGISRTVAVAAERIRRRIASSGWKAKLLNRAEIDALNLNSATNLLPALEAEHWGACGPATMRAISYTPARSAWTTDNYREWCRVNTHRHVQVLRLDRRRGIDHAEMYYGYLTSDPNALETVSALGLRREYGQQGDILTAALPAARTVRPTAIPGKDIPEGTAFPIPLGAAGIGTFIGHTKTRAQVFVNFSTGAEPFYLITPAAMCQQLLLRLATSGRSIDITLPGDEWSRFATQIGATYHQNSDADIMVCTEDSVTDPTHPTQVRLVWTTKPSITPQHAIIAGRDECTLHSPQRQIRYHWSVSTAEEALFTIGASRHAAPPPPSVPGPPRQSRHARPAT